MAGSSFDPDQYLKEKSAAPAFDPDSYLKEKGAATSAQDESLFTKGKRLVKSTLDIGLPAAGAAVAGILATPESFGTATIPAGAMGYAAGKQLARMLDQHVFGEDGGASGAFNIAKQTAGDLKSGAEFEMGGRILGEVPGLIKSGAGAATRAANNLIKSKLGPNIDYTPIPNKAAVEQAGKALDLDIPKGVLTNNPTYQKLESGLSQSGSLPAKGTRDQYNDFFKGIEKASSKIEDLKTSKSDFAIGSSIKDDLASQVNQSRAPVSEMYKDLTPNLQKIPVSAQVVNKEFGVLKRNPIFQTKDGIEALEDAKAVVLQQPELNSLKEYRSTIHDAVGNTSAPIDSKRADAIHQAVTKIRDNSISVMKSELPDSLHPEVDGVIDQVTLADQAHAANLKDLNSVKGIVGSKEISSPSQFLNKLSDMKEGELAERAANLDVSSMRNLKSKFPSIFDKAQAAKINDMVQRSTNPSSGFNVNTFMKQYGGMDQEMKDLIFTPDVQAHISNLQTVKQAILSKLGPSGTPEGKMMMDMFNPKRNALDFGIKNVLEVPGQTASQLRGVNPTQAQSKVANVLQMIPRSSASSSSAALPAVASDAQKKGSDKWASDGFDKVIQHETDPNKIQKFKEMRAKLLSDMNAKRLFISASDLKPGSKAMDKIVDQINSQIEGTKK